MAPALFDQYQRCSINTIDQPTLLFGLKRRRRGEAWVRDIPDLEQTCPCRDGATRFTNRCCFKAVRRCQAFPTSERTCMLSWRAPRGFASEPAWVRDCRAMGKRNQLRYSCVRQAGPVGVHRSQGIASYTRRWVLQQKYAQPAADPIPLDRRFVCCVDLTLRRRSR